MALLVCVIMMGGLVAVSGITLSLALARRSAAKTAIEVDDAYVVAEAGVARGLYELQLGADNGADGIGNATGRMGPGNYSATLTPAFAGPGEYTIRSVGTVHSIRRGVSVVVRAQGNGIGFFASNGITMSGGLIDSYNSGTGTYASQVIGGHAHAQGSIATNGNVAISGSANIWGNATPGPAKLVTGTTSGVHGSTAPASALVTIPPYVYAPPIPTAGSLSASKTFTTGTYRYTQVTAGGGKTLTFNGDVILYVDDKFTISGSGVGIVKPGAHVTIYQGTNDFTISGGGVINQNLNPANLTVYSATATAVTVSGSAAFYGTIHAPTASFTDSGSAGFYGAVQAKTMTISGGANLHYDEALGSASNGFGVFLSRTFRP